jgi:hypothetical protein
MRASLPITETRPVLADGALLIAVQNTQHPARCPAQTDDDFNQGLPQSPEKTADISERRCLRRLGPDRSIEKGARPMAASNIPPIGSRCATVPTGPYFASSGPIAAGITSSFASQVVRGFA